MRDVERSVAWYSDVLGFHTLRVMDDRTLMAHRGSGIVLGLAGHQANPGTPFNELDTGLDHIALTVTDRAALEEWLRVFDEHGVEHSPIKQGPRGWLITFRDPDNIQLEVYTRGS